MHNSVDHFSHPLAEQPCELQRQQRLRGNAELIQIPHRYSLNNL